MMKSLEVSLIAKMEKLKLKDQEVATLRRLGFSPNHEVYWSDEDDDELPVTARTKKTSEKAIKKADFGERLDLDRNMNEPVDKFLDQGFTCKDLKWADARTLERIVKKVRKKRYVYPKIATKIGTNFHSKGLARKRVNQAVFAAYKEDILDRYKVYEFGLRAMDELCIGSRPEGRSSYSLPL